MAPVFAGKGKNMNNFITGGIAIAFLVSAVPLQAAPPVTIWNSAHGPALPLQYVESTANLRLTPQNANAETYASAALYSRLYPSITQQASGASQIETTIQPSIASKNGDFQQFSPRVNLSPSYVQEYAYIDTYSNSRQFDNMFRLANIQMSLAMPQFGNGFGGGYPPLRFGFGPVGMGTW